uniref:Uncharacterized protein n=1 Tax=Anguilla anguilla TaxID=7936 RepID=A0A0E9XAN1_ANGAN
MRMTMMDLAMNHDPKPFWQSCRRRPVRDSSRNRPLKRRVNLSSLVKRLFQKRKKTTRTKTLWDKDRRGRRKKNLNTRT